MKFRKKPVVIEAIQFLGDENGQQIVDWIGKHDCGFYGTLMTINTLEGQMSAQCDDWIIRGVKGEFYPCKPDVFAETYEQASSTTQPAVLTPEELVEIANQFMYSSSGYGRIINKLLAHIKATMPAKSEHIDGGSSYVTEPDYSWKWDEGVGPRSYPRKHLGGYCENEIVNAPIAPMPGRDKAVNEMLAEHKARVRTLEADNSTLNTEIRRLNIECDNLMVEAAEFMQRADDAYKQIEALKRMVRDCQVEIKERDEVYRVLSLTFWDITTKYTAALTEISRLADLVITDTDGIQL